VVSAKDSSSKSVASGISGRRVDRDAARPTIGCQESSIYGRSGGQLASRIPGARVGSVEIQPVMEFNT
jgi:hypothetical protein